MRASGWSRRRRRSDGTKPVVLAFGQSRGNPVPGQEGAGIIDVSFWKCGACNFYRVHTPNYKPISCRLQPIQGRGGRSLGKALYLPQSSCTIRRSETNTSSPGKIICLTSVGKSMNVAFATASASKPAATSPGNSRSAIFRIAEMLLNSQSGAIPVHERLTNFRNCYNRILIEPR